MKNTIITLLAILALSGNARAADAVFSWLPNSETDLAGYKIHCGIAPKAYTITADVGKPALVDGRVVGGVSGLAESTTYYCAATAYDVAGNMSGYSNEVTVAIGDISPTAPGGLQYMVNFSGVMTLIPIK